MDKTLEELLGLPEWHPITELPDTDRLVACVYEDGSGKNVRGFCDSISQEPPTNKRIWWEFNNRGFFPYDDFGAWRELTEEEKDLKMIGVK